MMENISMYYCIIDKTRKKTVSNVLCYYDIDCFHGNKFKMKFMDQCYRSRDIVISRKHIDIPPVLVKRGGENI
jgi:hypothetical protein